MKKTSLLNSKLYVVFSPPDIRALGVSLESAVQQMVLGGADILQLRDKHSSDRDLIQTAKALRPLVHQSDALFIINDRPQVALASGADGVHLGQDDTSYAEARQLLGHDRLIGISTHSESQALAAEKSGADYIGVGPIHSTPTKPDYACVGYKLIEMAAQSISVPFFAIGGIDSSNIAQVTDAGASRVAVVRAAIAKQDIRQCVRELKHRLLKNLRKADLNVK